MNDQHEISPSADLADDFVTPGSYLSVVTRRSGDRCEVVCRGEIDYATGGQFYDAVSTAVTDPTVDHIEIDLADVSFFSAAAIGTLGLLRTAARERGTTLTLRKPSPPVHRLLTLTGLSRLCGENPTHTARLRRPDRPDETIAATD
ncbi:STAS domain-containing protein [Nocardia xishanensis]|uniref:STAS domain-containing protein n=1 Tax=Nocardia xishanensis TaxID=238964 RepID=UPI00083615A2|nr:STAS domain-containing protein [Nocardia xishanensis]